MGSVVRARNMNSSFLFRIRGARQTANQILAGLLVVSFLFSPSHAFAEEQVAPKSSVSEVPAAEAPPVAESSPKASNLAPEGGSSMSLLSGDNGSQLDIGKTPVNTNLKLEPSAFDGSLQYEFPLTVPPGRNGLQPSLTLQYSSRPSRESNLFGYGWSISIPYIERRNYMGVNQLYSHDAFYSSLSGELASTSVATVYKAKVETGDYLNYTFSGNTWTVTDAAGMTYKFGHASSTQQYVASSTQQVYKWMLQEVRDTNNNFITYSYTKDSNQLYPDVITYTGNGATPGSFDVHFTKELRSDIATSTAEGFDVVTKYRISEIKAEVNDAWVRSYTLGYGTGDNGQRSVLTSIIEAGSDGTSTTTLPAATYDYQDSVDSWTQSGSWDLTQAFVSGGYADTGVRIAEANGDGLPDILRSDGTGSNVVYLNTGTGWSTSSAFLNPIVYKVDNTVHPGNILVDINGDGRTDVAKHIENSGLNVIYMNNGSGWTLSSSTVPVALAKSNGGDNGVRVADVNGDGLPDLVRNHGGDGTVGNKTYINNGSTWVLDTSWVLPEYTVLNDNVTDPGTRIVDINGDSLADVIRRDATANVVYLNNGSGWTLSSTTVPVKFMDNGEDQGTRLEDVNGDGLIDILQRNASTNVVYLNTGGAWVQDSSWSIPAKVVDLDGGVLVDKGTRFADVNGDGLLDVLNYIQGGTDYVYLRNGEKPDLLATSTNQLGGVTSITYKGSPEYGGVNPYTPFGLDTVQKTLYNDGIGTWDTEYLYQDGIYYADNVRDRKFSGFGLVTTTDDLGYATKQYFHQGSSTSSTIGEYDDHIAKLGKVFRTETYDASSNLYSKTINKWDRYDRGDGASFVKLAEVLDFSYDGDSDHKEKADVYTYNNTYGNATQKVNYGEVSGSDDGTFSDSGSDKFTSIFTYATSTATSTVYKLSQETVTDQSANKVREKKLYYDTLSFGSLNKGNPTKEEQWKTSSTYIDLEKTYNSYGLVTQDKDARDKITSYVYDALNLYPATTTNPLSQTVQRIYNYSSGNVATTTDANGRVFVNVYDGLDRVVAEKQPDLTTPSTLVTKAIYQYSDSVFPRKVQKTSYLGTATSTDMYSFVDGYGKKLHERTEAEGTNTYAVKDYRYDSRGLLKTESLPYFATGTTYTGTSTPPTATLLLSYLYDPLQRVSAAGNAVGTTTYAYDDWKVTSTDAEGNVKDLIHDAYGNLKQVVEYNGASPYTTSYEYNGNNKLTKITDAATNERNFTYDGLGRRLTAQDLHGAADGTYGTWTYTYDDAGNVSSVVDPKSQTVDFTYDDTNRVLTENYTGGAGTEISYAYDSCSEGVGRLCVATSTDAVTTFTYNALGLPATETRTIDGAAYVTSYVYDRLGNITTLTYPDNAETAYAYNSAGQMEGVSHKAAGGSYTSVVSDFDYAPTGKVSYKEFANGVSSTYTFDATKLYRLTNIYTVATSSGESLMGGGGGMGFASDPWQSLARAMEGMYVVSTVEAPAALEEGVPVEADIPSEEVPVSDSEPVIEVLPEQPVEIATTTPEITATASSTEPVLPVLIPETVSTTTVATSTVEQVKSIRTFLVGKSDHERATIKGNEFAKLGAIERTSRKDSDIEVVSIEAIPGGVQVFARAWTKDGRQYGFGTDGSVDIERFRIFNPPIMVPDGTRHMATSTLPGGKEHVFEALGFKEDPKEALLAVLEEVIALKKEKFGPERIAVGKVGNTTTTFYPARFGEVRRGDSLSESWATLRGGNGNVAAYDSSSMYAPFVNADGATNMYGLHQIPLFPFDTSVIGTDTISAGTFSIVTQGEWTSNGNLDVNLSTGVMSSPVGITDYENTIAAGTTALSSNRTISSFTSDDSTYNDFTLNSTGLGAINESGETVLSMRFGIDITASGTPTWSSYGQSGLQHRNSDYAGTTKDPRLVLEHSVASTPGNGLQNITFGYDKVGNVTSINDSSDTLTNRTVSFTYDDLNRLITASTTAATSTPFSHTYAYSAIGNISSSTPSGAYTYAGTGYINPHAPTSINGTSLAYDTNGNLTSHGSDTYGWDYRNRMASSTVSSVDTTYGYDHSMQRVKKTTNSIATVYPNQYFDKENATTTKYVWAGNNIVAIIEGNGSATSTEYVHSDHLGSTNITSNENGQATSIADYMPFGALRIDSSEDFDPAKKFTGHELDRETNLTYAGARYYNQGIGRWISQDPASKDSPEQFLKDPQQLNYYSYARNNPLGFVDPTGEDIYWYSDGTLARNTASGHKQYFESQDIKMLNNNTTRMRSSENYGNLNAFYSFVRNGGEWDYKNNNQGREYYFFDGELVDKETFGNRHYGYTGAAGGFNETTLKAAGGYAQMQSGNAEAKDIGTYFDDPKDTTNVGIGISTYNSNYGSNPANIAQIAVQSTRNSPAFASIYRQVQQLQKQVDKLVKQLNKHK